MGKFRIDGMTFDEKVFNEAMEAVRAIDPVLADCIEGAAYYCDDDEDFG